MLVNLAFNSVPLTLVVLTLSPLILNKSTTAMIKTAFCLLIGQNGPSATDVFMPLPTQRVKFIDNFLVLICNMKYMMVDNKKHEYK